MSDYRIVYGRDFLRANLSGELDFIQSKRLLRQLIRINTPASRDLLVDIRESTEILMFKQINFLVKELVKHAPDFQGKIAFLDNWDSSANMTQFLEFEVNRKGFKARTFFSYENALEWLLPQSDSESLLIRSQPPTY